MQGIVIQGPTNYYKDITEYYSDIPNVIFSTWDDEPFENINYIKSKNIDVITSPKPLYNGYLNVNYQTFSTFKGIQYLKNKGITEILKVRSDLIPNNIKLLLNLLKNKSLSFLAICKPNVRPLIYELGYIHNSFDFPVDLILYGNINNLEKCFNFQIEEYYPIPPESLIAYNYFINNNLDFKLNYETFIKNNISFFMRDCLENNIKINWLKNNIDIIKLHSDINLYDY
jgi:hypothetical protein